MQKRRYRHHDESFKLEVLQDYYLRESSFGFLCRKHELRSSVLSEWIKRYPVDSEVLSLSGEKQLDYMATRPQQEQEQTLEEVLRQRVESLEKALHYANLRVEGLNVMIEIAEKSEGIQIRKKFGAKQ